METPKAGDQVKVRRRTLTVIWAAANHVIYVTDDKPDCGHVVSMSEWRKLTASAVPVHPVSPDTLDDVPEST